MPRIVVPISGVDSDHLSQLEYALTFASEDIVSYTVNRADLTIEVEVKSEEACEGTAQKVHELVQRYERREFGLAKRIHFRQDRDLPMIDAWQGLLDRKWVTPVGEGQVVLRGLAADLVDLLDKKIDSMFARAFGAEREFYPSTILCTTLDRTHHFTSFPEHIDFVAHLKPDLAVINAFGKHCREGGWSADAHEGRMAQHDFAIAPSCCYHCYEAMEGWRLEPPGKSVTATLGCHRYEGANHRSLSRLRAFTMREVVWVGHPRYVVESRGKAEDLIIQWAKDWELAGTFETANDCFFTEDYAVKASFQRQQQAKKELRLVIPAERQSISVFSSNFHATTFGKAFNISVGDRPATSGCVGWGYERWVYAIFSQFGFDPSLWPPKLRDDFEKHNLAKDQKT
jgi:seryl-tRNA synthetase